jgi:hypothetical protein
MRHKPRLGGIELPSPGELEESGLWAWGKPTEEIPELEELIGILKRSGYERLQPLSFFSREIQRADLETDMGTYLKDKMFHYFNDQWVIDCDAELYKSSLTGDYYCRMTVPNQKSIPLSSDEVERFQDYLSHHRFMYGSKARILELGPHGSRVEVELELHRDNSLRYSTMLKFYEKLYDSMLQEAVGFARA